MAVSMGRGGGAGCHTDLSGTSSERQRAGYSGWWLNQTHLKNIRQIIGSFPKSR